MSFKENNNRKTAKKLAEFITGETFRKYVAEKVKQYAGENISVFDGAIGSGQLEQFINPTKIYGVDIQEMSVSMARENFENTELEVGSFFNYDRDITADVTVMNPPFSIRFKDLTEREQANIQEEFSWKKNGNVDDIFVLKSLKYAKRFGFYILFPGICYRATEQKFRELIGNQLQELNIIQNGFDDTKIDVVFIVIDKEKSTNEVHKAIYDCKTSEIKKEEKSTVETDTWSVLREESVKEEINIHEVNKGIEKLILERLETSLDSNLLTIKYFGADIDFMGLLSAIRKICNRYEEQFKLIKNGNILGQL